MTKNSDVVFLSCYLVPFLACAFFCISTYVEEGTFSSREKSRLSCSLFIPDNGRYCTLILAGSTELYWICEVADFVKLKVWLFFRKYILQMLIWILALSMLAMPSMGLRCYTCSYTVMIFLTSSALKVLSVGDVGVCKTWLWEFLEDAVRFW